LCSYACTVAESSIKGIQALLLAEAQPAKPLEWLARVNLNLSRIKGGICLPEALVDHPRR